MKQNFININKYENLLKHFMHIESLRLRLCENF